MSNKKYLDLGGVSRLVTNINSKYISRDNIGSEVAAVSHEHTASDITDLSSITGSAYVEVYHGVEDTTFTLTPNTFHVWDEVASLTLTLGGETAGVANEFLFQFNSGSTATTLTLPDTLKWANNSVPIIEPNKIYQISILKGLGSVLEFDITLITFTIEGTEYQAAEGMTWEQWVVSSYSTSGYAISFGDIISPWGGYVALSGQGGVDPSDLIVANTNYYNSYYDGGGTDD